MIKINNNLIKNIYIVKQSYKLNLLKQSYNTRTLTTSADSTTPESQYRYTIYYFETPLNIKVGDKFAVSVENIEVIEGNPTEFTILLYDTTTGKNINYGGCILTQNKLDGIITVTKDGICPSLLAYAGIAGSTRGNTVRYTKMMLTNSNIPISWCPSISDESIRFNLLNNTDVYYKNSEYLIAQYNLNEIPIEGNTYTFTLWGELSPNKTAFKIFNSNSSIPLTPLYKSKSGVYSAIFTWTNSSNVTSVTTPTYISVWTLYNTQSGESVINKVKLEEGANQNPEWIPAKQELNNYKISKIYNNKLIYQI